MIDTWLAISRAIHFAACLMIAGVWLFDRFVAGQSREIYRPIRRRILAASLPLALLSGLAWFALIAVEMSGLPAAQAMQWPTLKLVWNQTHFGQRWQWRFYFFLLAVAASLVFHRLAWLALLCSIPLLMSLAWVGHGRYGRPMDVHLAADAVHLLAAACWPMGLVPLAFVLLKIRKSELPDKWLRAGQIVRRFSALSLVSVAVLAMSGLINSYFLIGSISDLYQRPYGKLLLLKISLFVSAMCFGAINLLHLKPRVTTQSSKGAARLQWMIAAEILVVALILLATGKLGLLTPTRR